MAVPCLSATERPAIEGLHESVGRFPTKLIRAYKHRNNFCSILTSRALASFHNRFSRSVGDGFEQGKTQIRHGRGKTVAINAGNTISVFIKQDRLYAKAIGPRFHGTPD
jgi:hypothetical protein